MKKLLIITLIIAVALILCACGKTITDEHGNKHYLYGVFVVLEDTNYRDRYGNEIHQSILYDKTTKVVYVHERGIYSAALSPYYINNNGVAEVAIYGVNYN